MDAFILSSSDLYSSEFSVNTLVMLDTESKERTHTQMCVVALGGVSEEEMRQCQMTTHRRSTRPVSALIA